MKSVLLYIWQLPQNLIGLLVIAVTKAERKLRVMPERNVFYYLSSRCNSKWSGVSLGKYIIFAKDFHATNRALKHEYGHQRQSVYLGWLYPIVIGLPSVIGNLLQRKLKFDYDKQPWEHWANVLGGLK